jgi:NADH-quinone oxidoreductase subunit N
MGTAAVLAFAMIYGLTSVASFVFIVAMRENEPGWDGTVAGLAGLARRSPALAASLAVIMLSLTGIPLTAGFWGKYLVFGQAATGGYLWLAIVAVLGSVVSFGYYGRVIRSAYMDAAPEAGEREEQPPVTNGLAAAGAVVLAIVIVLVGVFPLVA